MAVLVAYASRFGSTREIAGHVAARLRERGHAVELKSAAQVADVDPYEAVVMGSAVYDGSWLPEATQLARRAGTALADRPVWLFSVGAFGDRHRVIGRWMKREPREIRWLREAARPRDYRVFAGAIERGRWSLLGGLVLKVFGGGFGDRRNWPEIDAWAVGIARELERAAPDGR